MMVNEQRKAKRYPNKNWRATNQQHGVKLTENEGHPCRKKSVHVGGRSNLLCLGTRMMMKTCDELYAFDHTISWSDAKEIFICNHFWVELLANSLFELMHADILL